MDFEVPLNQAPRADFASLEGQASTWHGLSTWQDALRPLRSVLLITCHAIALFWRVTFAVLVPPLDWANGWPAYLGSLCIIAGICAVVIELSSLFACASGKAAPCMLLGPLYEAVRIPQGSLRSLKDASFQGGKACPS